jgi:hypothetical protein
MHLFHGRGAAFPFGLSELTYICIFQIPSWGSNCLTLQQGQQRVSALRPRRKRADSKRLENAACEKAVDGHSSAPQNSI